jgi:hypothetical protein
VSNGIDQVGAIGLPGFVFRAVIDDEGEQLVLVETSRAVAGCPGCGVVGVGNGRRYVIVRDLPIGDHPTVVVWAKRTLGCREELC